jgi:hypothetical protein
LLMGADRNDSNRKACSSFAARMHGSESAGGAPRLL